MHNLLDEQQEGKLRFVMYTEKTVPQAMRAINDRLQTGGTKARQYDGWVEKSGRFAFGVTTIVHGRFKRKTVMRGQAERDGGITVVSGDVPGGLSRDRQMIVFAAMILIALLLLSQGGALVAIAVLICAAALSVPLQGDFDNSELLLTELQRTLKARFTPPK
jgi:hypothetical protein